MSPSNLANPSFRSATALPRNKVIFHRLMLYTLALLILALASMIGCAAHLDSTSASYAQVRSDIAQLEPIRHAIKIDVTTTWVPCHMK
jgi:hypothetical protein